MNYHNGKTKITENTRTIHNYAETRHNSAERKIDGIRCKLYDTKFRGGICEKVAIFPFRIWNKLINIMGKREH